MSKLIERDRGWGALRKLFVESQPVRVNLHRPRNALGVSRGINRNAPQSIQTIQAGLQAVIRGGATLLTVAEQVASQLVSALRRDSRQQAARRRSPRRGELAAADAIGAEIREGR